MQMDVVYVDTDLINEPAVDERLSLTASMEGLGYLIHPIALRPHGDRFDVVWGNHRTVSAKQLRKKRKTADQWEKVPAVIDTRRAIKAVQNERAYATLIENHIRENNPGAEAKAVKTLMASGQSVEEISAGTGVKLRVVKGLARLHKELHPSAFEALCMDQMSPSAAMQLLKLPAESQEKVVEMAEGERIRLKDVNARVRLQQQDLLSDLDGVVPSFSSNVDLANQVDAAANEFTGKSRTALVNAAAMLREGPS